MFKTFGSWVVGDVLYFYDREGYRNANKKNVGYHAQLADYVVIEHINYDAELGWVVSLAGFPHKQGAIIWDDCEDGFFSEVGHIDNSGYGMADIKKDPYAFSREFKAGCHIRSDNDTVLYMDTLFYNMSNFNPTSAQNNDELSRVFASYQESGNMLPSDMAYVINRVLLGLYNSILNYNQGDIKTTMKDVRDLLCAKATVMNKE